MKNYIIKITSTIILLSTLFVFACDDKQTANDDPDHSEAATASHSENEEGVHLTKEQIKSIGLDFGTVSTIKINGYIKSTGTLGLPPNAYSAVSSKTAGILRIKKRIVEGDFINKGETIAYVENPEIIIKQQDYLEAKALLGLKKLNLERQQSLTNANAGVSKNLENAKAEVAITEAKMMGLAKQLSYLGISPERLSPQTIKQSIAITAPMDGFISNISMFNWMYAQPSVSLMEIISDEHLHLELDVFEKDIAGLNIGQKISYTVPALDNTLYEGEVSVIGKEFNLQSKTVRVHGHLEGKKPMFLKDLFINARIWLNDTTSEALPEAAVLTDGSSSFVYVANNEGDKKEVEFIKVTVIPTTTSNGFTAIKFIDKIPKGMKIVIKGAYYVDAQSKAGNLEHEH